ncbi:MAG: NAD-dependent epimerase/dehydratase family protein, partial [Candidatus Polarisedimenticolia bacterium]
MRLFLTGATGFLGQELLKELHARRHHLTALVRSPQRASGFPSGVRLVPGSIEEPGSYRSALAGHDAFVHVAALVKMWTRDRKQFDRVNVEGTEQAIRAAADAGVRKFVYVSSFIALGPSNGAPLTEEDPRRTAVCHNDYERTKLLADRIARRYIGQGYPLYVLYPGVIYGPGSLTDGNLVAKNLIPFLNGTMPFGVAIKSWSYAFVQDVVGGLVKVIEGEPPSRRYILGGDNRSGEEFYRAIQEVTGRRPPRFNIPLGVASLTGWGEYLLAELFGREPKMLTHEVVRVYKRSWTYDSSRAIHELGYRITPLREGLARLVAWLK